MAAKGFILLGLGVFTYLALLSTPRVLEKGIRAYLMQTLPGSTVDVHVAAPAFWFFSGNLHRISVTISHFDAAQFPIPTAENVAVTETAEAPPSTTLADISNSAAPALARTLVKPGVVGGDGEDGEIELTTGPGPQHASGVDPIAHPARIGQIDLDLSDFTFAGQHVGRLRASIPDVEYDFALARKKHLLKLGRSSSGTIRINLTESDLNTAVVLDRPEIRGLHVYPEAGRLRVTLEYHTVLGWVPVEVTGELAVVDGHSVWFVNPAISAARVPFPQPVTDFIEKRVSNLNPVFDLSRLRLPMAAQLTSVQSAPGDLSINGVIQIPSGARPV